MLKMEFILLCGNVFIKSIYKIFNFLIMWNFLVEKFSLVLSDIVLVVKMLYVVWYKIWCYKLWILFNNEIVDCL